MHHRFNILIFVVFWFTLTSISKAQPPAEPEIIDSVKGTSCEFVSSAYDGFIQGTPANKKIIIVAYVGKDDTRKNIAQRRLYNAKTYMVEAYKDTRFSRPDENIVTAVGVEVRKEGQLDFYLNGTLKLSVLFKKDRDFNVQPCYIEFGDYCDDSFKKKFYPCLDRKNRENP